MTSLSPDLRCERCFHSLPPNEGHCPNCGLVVPKATPGGKALGMAGKYAAPKSRQEQATLATRELRGRIMRETLTGIPKKGFHQSPLVMVLAGLLAIGLGGVAGWGFLEFQHLSAQPADEGVRAVRLVSRSTARQGGTIEQAAGVVAAQLADQGKVQDFPGWNVEKDGNRWRVRFTIQEKGQEPKIAEWVVDLAQKNVQPENDWARQLSK